MLDGIGFPNPVRQTFAATVVRRIIERYRTGLELTFLTNNGNMLKLFAVFH